MTAFLFWKSSGKHRPYKIIIAIHGWYFIMKTFISISIRHRHFIMLIEVYLSNKAFFIIGQVLFPALWKVSRLGKICSTSQQRMVKDEVQFLLLCFLYSITSAFFPPLTAFPQQFIKFQNMPFCRFLLLRVLFQLKNSF